MKSSEHTSRVKAIREYLSGIGKPITSVQGREVLARALGYKNKHVLASSAQDEGASGPAPVSEAALPTFIVANGNSVPVMALNAEPLSVAQMAALDWTFDHVIPISLDNLGDTDVMNAVVSKAITGNEAALEDIGFEHIHAINYGSGHVAYRITGYVSSPADFFDEVENAADTRFYGDLLELANLIVGNAAIEVALCEPGDSQHVYWQRIDSVRADTRQLFQAYAESSGENNDDVNLHEDDVAFDTKPAEEECAGTPSFSFLLSNLKYAQKLDTRKWFVCQGTKRFILRFLEPVPSNSSAAEGQAGQAVAGTERVDEFETSERIKAEYLSGPCGRRDVDYALERLRAECAGIFANGTAMWEFLMDETHEDNEPAESGESESDELSTQGLNKAVEASSAPETDEHRDLQVARVLAQLELATGESQAELSGWLRYRANSGDLPAAILSVNQNYGVSLSLGDFILESKTEQGFWSNDFGWSSSRMAATGYDSPMSVSKGLMAGLPRDSRMVLFATAKDFVND